MIKSTKANGNGTYNWWMLTWNNPQGDWKQILASFEANYATAQLEEGENGTPHIQGCLYYVSARRATAFKGFTCWIKGIRLPEAQNVMDYSNKTDTRIDGPIELGNKPQSIPKGRDWASAYKAAQEGKLEEVKPDIAIPYWQNLLKISAFYSQPYEVHGCRGVWVYGKSGQGKSHYVREKYPNIYSKDLNKWWDNYRGEEIVLLDDLSKNGACLGHHLKIWTDKYACKGEIKGGTVNLKHHTFFVTSQYLPSAYWADDPEMLEAVERRFTFIHIHQYKIVSILWNCTYIHYPNGVLL